MEIPKEIKEKHKALSHELKEIPRCNSISSNGTICILAENHIGVHKNKIFDEFEPDNITETWVDKPGCRHQFLVNFNQNNVWQECNRCGFTTQEKERIRY